jgi:hypothetical protein
MRKFFILISLCCTLQNIVNAQYKKASFLNKEGVNYSIGGSLHSISKVKNNAKGILISFGREKSSSRSFHWYDLEFLPKSNMTFNSFGYNFNTSQAKFPVIVNAKSNQTILLRYNLGYKLLQDEEYKKAVIPFLLFNIGGGITGGEVKYTTTPIAQGITQDFYDVNSIAFAGLGVGVTVRATKNIGFKLSSNYNITYTSDFKQNYDYDYKNFVTFPSHLVTNVSFVWTIIKDED